MPLKKRFSFDTIISVMNSIGTAWVFVLLILINLDIFGRFLFNHPIRGVPEIVSLSIVALVFLQIAHTLKVGRLTRSETLLNFLRAKFPAVAQFVEGIFNVIGALLFAIVFIGSAPMFVKAWRIGEYVGAEGDFMISVWPVKLIILIGSVAGIIQYLLLAFENFRQLAAVAQKQMGTKGDCN
ncbi:TRAP transporter small permease [bacterium]|nr:TRAP transporter small permease [bacterium]